MRLLLLQLKAKNKEPQFVQDCLAKGKVEGPYLDIAESDYREIKERYQKGTKAVFPPVRTQLRNAAGAFARAATAFVRGEPVFVSPEVKDARRAICEKCELFTGFRCTGCGCVGTWKQWLETEKGQCPLHKW